jgi:anti-sigma-K factor RskA
VARARDAVVAAWSPGGDPAGAEVSGEMAWSGAAQVGVMRLSGLEPNAVGLQYQLWIFDGTRDERYPVDGGVFDVPPGAEEVEVPVRPAVPVRSPVLFAVTVERAGGVVVSDRERIATLAEVEE